MASRASGAAMGWRDRKQMCPPQAGREVRSVEDETRVVVDFVAFEEGEVFFLE
jgi:hypothetical protein